MSIPTPAQIWDYYLAAIKGLEMLNTAIEDYFSAPPLPSPIPVLRDPLSPFFGKRPNECRDLLQEFRKELEEQVTLVLMGSVEALLRIDFESRKAQPSAVLHAIFKSLDIQYNGKVPLEEILDGWKSLASVDPHVIGEIKKHYNLRHWLAHGRYWVQTSGLDVASPVFLMKRLHDMLSELKPHNFYSPLSVPAFSSSSAINSFLRWNG